MPEGEDADMKGPLVLLEIVAAPLSVGTVQQAGGLPMQRSPLELVCPEWENARLRPSGERWSQFVRQRAKVDSPMQRMNHHEDAETVFG
jgi:hypothetical protein